MKTSIGTIPFFLDEKLVILNKDEN